MTEVTTEDVKPAPEPRRLERASDVQTPERDQVDRQVFDAILAKHTGEPKAEQPAPTVTPDETPQPTGQAPQKESPEPEAKEPSASSDNRTAAEQFLKLKARVPQSALDTLSDAEIQEWADERRQRESTVDAAFARAKRAEKENVEPSSEEATAEGEPQEPTPDPDFNRAMDALADELALTDDGRARLDDAFAKALAPLKSQVETFAQLHQQNEAQAKNDFVAQVRHQIGERFPDLSSDDIFQEVLQDAAALEDSPAYAGSGRAPEEYIPDLLVAVARGRQLKEVPTTEAVAAEREATLRDSERQQRVAADAGPITSRPSEPRETTQAEQDWQVFQAVRDRHRAPGV